MMMNSFEVDAPGVHPHDEREVDKLGHVTIGLNGRILFFAAIVLVITVVVCGLAPAVFATCGELAADLKTQGATFRGSVAQSRLGSLLIVTQVALSVTLLVGAGLLLHSLFNLETFNAGFDRDKVT